MFKILILISLLFSSLSFALDVKTFIPPKAYQYKDTINTEIMKTFPDIPEYNYVPSLIEHESCISLTHSRCWSPTSKLQTSRELGVGLGQLTKAYNADGSIRFDKLQELRDQYRGELRDLSWSTIQQRPDLQIRAIIIMLRSSYYKLEIIKDPHERLKFVDAAYNGGDKGVEREIRACYMAKDCKHQLWFNNVERYCLKSKKVLYGQRSACDISRAHVQKVILISLPKYKKYYF